MPCDSSLRLLSISQRAIEDGQDATCIAWGELGLDYDRLHFASKELQLKWCAAQISCFGVEKPYFFHCRHPHAFPDLLDLINKTPGIRGVVHSFDGDVDAAGLILANPQLYIGINGCSLKTEENLEVLATLPLERLLLETDAPWCDVRPTHAGWRYVDKPVAQTKKPDKYVEGLQVKGRNEPCNIGKVASVVAGVLGVSVEHVAKVTTKNALKLFPF